MVSKKELLSIVILSYNTKKLLFDCLSSLKDVKNEFPFEVIVVDNNSIDGSDDMVEKEFPDVVLVRNDKNIGFAAGNNKARNIVKGEYVLFLNSDTVVYPGVIKETVSYLKKHKDIGALSCKLVLADGTLDKDVRRSFITPWVGFVHLILRLDRIFPRSKLFGRYWYGYISEDRIHDVDVLQGAFFLTRKKILDDVGWFDEDYFLDGEDIDLCWRIKERGWRLVYYPKVKILHLKGVSKGKLISKKRRRIKLSEKIKIKSQGVRSMEIFYRKRLWQKYPLVINILVILGIKSVLFARIFKSFLEWLFLDR
jgi:GT2 family glycosyltransferase